MVGDGDHVFIGLGADLFGLAIIAALAGFFVFWRKSNGAREREIMSSLDNDMDIKLLSVMPSYPLLMKNRSMKKSKK